MGGPACGEAVRSFGVSSKAQPENATNAQAVETLRQRKNREEKPFALMVPDVETARQFCHVDAGAEAARRVGEVISVHVIPRPHDGVEKV